MFLKGIFGIWTVKNESMIAPYEAIMNIAENRSAKITNLNIIISEPSEKRKIISMFVKNPQTF